MRRSHKPNDFLTHHPEYHHIYHQLLTEAIRWQSQSQYGLANEARRRAKCIREGDLPGYLQQIHSEHLFIKTKRF
jgi:hypothetical protein